MLQHCVGNNGFIRLKLIFLNSIQGILNVIWKWRFSSFKFYMYGDIFVSQTKFC